MVVVNLQEDKEDNHLLDEEKQKVAGNKPPFHPIVWKCMIIGGVFLYSSFAILVHLSKVDGAIPFNSLTSVICTEFTKLLLSSLLFLFQTNSNSQSFTCMSVYAKLQSEFTTTNDAFPEEKKRLHYLRIILPFSIPAILYAINNNLGYALQTEMDPATYQVLGNFKIITTAILFRLIIQRPITKLQWISICLLLVAGIMNGLSNTQLAVTKEAFNVHITVKGMLMISVYVTISGLSGVCTEYILKDRAHMNLNIQNALLYIFGLIINGAMFLTNVFKSKGEINPFKGFNAIVVLIILTQSIIGLFMGCIMKYANNIVRLFVISMAVVVTTLLSVILFGLVLNFSFIISAGLVILAVILYQW